MAIGVKTAMGEPEMFKFLKPMRLSEQAQGRELKRGTRERYKRNCQVPSPRNAFEK